MTAPPPCPICKKAALPRPGNLAFPFCSARCKMVDLGKWLNEDYRMPTEDSPAEDARDGSPQADGGAPPGQGGTRGEED